MMTRVNEAAGRYLWVAYVVIIAWIVSVAVMASDRKAPLKILPMTPPTVTRGETTIFRIPVERDLSRSCESRFARYIFASDGARYDLGPGYLTPQTIAEMERKTPGQIVVAVPIPDTIASGPATLVSEQAYACNKVHSIWPIQVSTQIAFVVR